MTNEKFYLLTMGPSPGWPSLLLSDDSIEVLSEPRQREVSAQPPSKPQLCCSRHRPASLRWGFSKELSRMFCGFRSR